MDLSYTEENYIKAIFKLSKQSGESVTTNGISSELNTTPASVSDMLKKLAVKSLVNYIKYHGVQLTEVGEKTAIHLIRRHRLWEVFLVEKLNFNWDQVHIVAEELEHINSPLLTERLEEYLGYPTFDPHGDPIPDADGKIQYHEPVSLSELKTGEKGIIVKVDEQSSDFLQYLDKHSISIHSKVEVRDNNEFDGSKQISINGKLLFVSDKVCLNLTVKKL